MPYVLRNPSGLIVALLSEPIEGGEEVSAHDQELTDFLRRETPEQHAKQELLESDLGLIRVVEDLIVVLIEKRKIMFTDFTKPVQDKLLVRRGVRHKFSAIDDELSMFEEADFIPDEIDCDGFI